MLLTKLVIRVMDVRERLLGWAEVEGRARGDGAIWVDEPTALPIDQEGDPLYLSIHWCDVNVEIRSKIEKSRVKVGDVMQIPGNWLAIRCGDAAGGLPPVTVRNPVTIGVPAGAFSARN